MTADKILVTIFGTLGIGLTYWFFLMKKEKAIEAKEVADVVVEGGYSPGVISVQHGKTTVLNFIRKDPNSCLEEVVIPEFKVRKFLPLNEKVEIAINPARKGKFDLSCGMNMYHGKIIVK